jgi:membrane protein
VTGEMPVDDAEGTGRIAHWRSRSDRAYLDYQERAKSQPVLGLPLAFIARYNARQGMLLASAAAFRLFLWLLPLALLTAGVLAALAGSDRDGLQSASRGIGLTSAASQQTATALHNGHSSWVIAVLTGAVLFLWATRTLIRNLVQVNAHAWGAPRPRVRQKDVLLTALIFAGAWMAVAGFIAGVHRLGQLVPGGLLLGAAAQAGAVGVLWFLISKRLPDRRRDSLDLVPGAVVFGCGLSVLNVVGRVYLPARFAHSSAMYGSLGIASVMLLWLLFVGQLIVSSSLANAVWSDYRSQLRGDSLDEISERDSPADARLFPNA